MLKFFRKIRQGLFEKGKSQQYILYAFGEILLVVIGILIALQINTWNQNRINRSKEQQALKNIQTDLQAQMEELKRFIDYEQKMMNNGNHILFHFQKNNGFKQLDTIYYKINALGSRANMEPFNTTYLELNSSGALGLIQNDSLRFQLIEYYRDLAGKTLAIEANNTSVNTDLINNQFFPLTIINFKKMTKELSGFANPNLKDIISIPYQRLLPTVEKQLAIPKNELILLNIVNLRIGVSSIHLSHYEAIKKSTQELIDTIVREIE